MQFACKRQCILAWTKWQILNSRLCLKYSHSKCKQEPRLALGQKVPLYPWTKLVTDIFHFAGASSLLVVDYSSRFLVVYKLTSMTGQHISTQCKLIFSEYRWQETLISDNGSCYTAKVFTNLMREYSVNHNHKLTSLPTIKWACWKVCSDCQELVL